MLSLLTTLSISFNNPHLNIIPNSIRIGYNICKTHESDKDKRGSNRRI